MTVDGSATLRHTAFATSDFSEARAFMDATYGGYLRIGDWQPLWKLSVDQIATGQVATADVRTPGDLTYEVDGHDELVIITVLAGGADYCSGSFDERMRRGAVYAGNHRALHCLCRTHRLHARTVSLPQSLMTAVAAESSPSAATEWKLTSIRPLPGGANRWRRATRLLDGLLADPDAATAPLVIGAAARLLAAVALAIFPNTAVAQTEAPDRRDAHPQTLRRAIAFIDANPDEDLTLGDIAGAASVTPRAIQLAFRRHLDTTPTAYLRQVRLSHARQDLLDAVPGDGQTVTRVAYDWGFANPSQFAAHYHDAYHEPPSQTLRR